MTELHSQASEEALLDEAMSDVCDDICAHQSTPGDCAAPHRVCRNCMADLLRKFVDRVSRERTRQALKDARRMGSAAARLSVLCLTFKADDHGLVKAANALAQELMRFKIKYPPEDPLSDGESVASEEK